MDLDWKQQLAKQCMDAGSGGQAVMPRAEDHDFPGVFMAADEVPEGGAGHCLDGCDGKLARASTAGLNNLPVTGN